MSQTFDRDKLRDEAQQALDSAGRFVDPSKVARVQGLTRPFEWRVGILGHSNQPSLVEMEMLLLADERNLEPPAPQARRVVVSAASRANQAARTNRIAVQAAAVEKMPAPFWTMYNYSGPNHRETYQQGATHAVLREPLHVGRLHRFAGDALCTTLSTRPHQKFEGEQRSPYERVSCKACLRVMGRLTGVDVTPLLGGVR